MITHFAAFVSKNVYLSKYESALSFKVGLNNGIIILE